MSSSAERSVAKNLVDIHLFPMLCVTKILPPYGRLDDKMERIIKKIIRENLCNPWCKKRNHKS